MKQSFVAFWKRNLAFAKLAVVTNLEYRLNYFIDAIVQPVVTSGIEILLWIAIFNSSQTGLIAGFNRDSYLSYTLWAVFFSRITTNWMYEFRMIEEVSSGTLNSLLTRPLSFYEYYFSQMMAYKFLTAAVSLIIPILACYFFKLPINYDRLFASICLSFYFLCFVHSISFIISTFAFHFTKISSVTVAKNLLFWILMGEVFPLDILPMPYKDILINLPFSAGVFTPVAYLVGRVGVQSMINSFISLTVSLVFLNTFAYLFWKKSLREYTGTGA